MRVKSQNKDLFTSPSKEYLRLKKKYETELTLTDQDLNTGNYESQRQKEAAIKQRIGSSNKRLRSNSPKQRFIPSNNNSSRKENPMDVYRLKKMKRSLNKKAIDTNEIAKRIDEIHEFTNEQSKN